MGRAGVQWEWGGGRKVGSKEGCGGGVGGGGQLPLAAAAASRQHAQHGHGK